MMSNRPTFTFRSEGTGDPTYGVYLDGQRIGAVSQDRGMRPLHWSAYTTTPVPTPEYPNAIRYDLAGWHKQRYEAALTLLTE